MASLRQLATELIDSIGIPYDYPTYKRAKNVIIQARALRIKQDITKHGVQDHYQQSYYTKLKDVDAVDNCVFEVGCTIKRSENKIPSPILYASDSPFLSVGNVLDPKSVGIELTYAYRDQIRYMAQRFPKATFYSWIDGYLYIYNPKHKYLIIRGIYDNPTLLPVDCNTGEAGICYDDEMEFPLPLSLIADVKNIVRNSDFLTATDYEEVKIDK